MRFIITTILIAFSLRATCQDIQTAWGAKPTDTIKVTGIFKSEHLQYTDATGANIKMVVYDSIAKVFFKYNSPTNADISGKLNISDTAAMLSTYLQTGIAALSYAAINHVHTTSDITTGTFANGRISQSSVTQYQAALSIGVGQITGLGTLATQSGTFSGTSSGTNTGDQIISDATISTTDITTNDASISKHGFMAKATGSTVTFYRSDGSQATPTGVNSSITFLSSDVINNNAVANTIADVTGLSFAVTSGITYRFRFYIVYSSAATTTGSRWSINGPAVTFLHYNSNYTLTATSITNNQGNKTYNVPAASSASSLTTGNISIIEGIIRPSANGTVIARFASEISSSAITAVGGKSFVEWQAIN